MEFEVLVNNVWLRSVFLIIMKLSHPFLHPVVLSSDEEEEEEEEEGRRWGGHCFSSHAGPRSWDYRHST